MHAAGCPLTYMCRSRSVRARKGFHSAIQGWVVRKNNSGGRRPGLWLIACATLVQADPMAELTRAQSLSLTNLAAERPCVALTLLYVFRMPGRAESGTYYLDRPPSAGVIAELLREPRPRALDFPLSPNPYGEVPYLIEVRWALSPLHGNASVLSARAELVDRTGAPIKPAHPVEQPTQVLITGSKLQVLGAAVPF
jgi:hypothetical protein